MSTGPPEWRPGEALLTVWWERPSNKLRMEVDPRGLDAYHWRELRDHCDRQIAAAATVAPIR